MLNDFEPDKMAVNFIEMMIYVYTMACLIENIKLRLT